MLCLPDPCHRLQAASPLTPGTRHTASPAPRHPPGTPGNRCFRGWLLGPQILKTRILSPYSAPSVPGQGRLRGVCGNAVLCSDSEISEQRKQDRRPSCRTWGHRRPRAKHPRSQTRCFAVVLTAPPVPCDQAPGDAALGLQDAVGLCPPSPDRCNCLAGGERALTGHSVDGEIPPRAPKPTLPGRCSLTR